MIPHPHKELIIAWANGAEIERWVNQDVQWKSDSLYPTWDENAIYRVKPKLKPDIILFCHVENLYTSGGFPSVKWASPSVMANIKIIWDGQTNEFKSIEAIK